MTAAMLLALPATALPSDPQAQAFVKSLVAAIKSNDAEKRKALLHPDSLRCATAQDERFAREARIPIPADIAWRLTPAPPGLPLHAERLDYPLRPTHRLRLDFSGPDRTTTIVLQLAQHDGNWREVGGCPKRRQPFSRRAAFNSA